MKKYKIIIIIIILAVVIFLAGKLLTGKKTGLKDETGIIKVKRGDIHFSVDIKAFIKPLKVVEIKAGTAGEIIKMPVEEGDFLEEGALIAEIENTFTKAVVDRSLQEFNAAKDNFEKINYEYEAEKETNQRLLKAAGDNLERVKYELQKAVEKEKMKEALKKNNIETESELIKQEVDIRFNIYEIQEKINKISKNKPVSNKELDSLKLSLESAKSEYDLVLQYIELTKKPIVEEKIDVEKFGIKQAEIELLKTEEKIKELKNREKDVISAEAEFLKKKDNLKLAEENLKNRIVTAPISGAISRKNFEKGQVISSKNTDNSSGTVVAGIADISKVYVSAEVGIEYLNGLKEGRQVKVKTGVFPEKDFEGLVVKIKPAETAVKNTETYEITFEIANPDKLLRPEKSLPFEIIIKEAKNVLFVPNEAILNFDTVKIVTVVKDGKITRRDVETGLSGRDFTEIISGLNEGDIVKNPEKKR